MSAKEKQSSFWRIVTRRTQTDLIRCTGLAGSGVATGWLRPAARFEVLGSGKSALTARAPACLPGGRGYSFNVAGNPASADGAPHHCRLRRQGASYPWDLGTFRPASNHRRASMMPNITIRCIVEKPVPTRLMTEAIQGDSRARNLISSSF